MSKHKNVGNAKVGKCLNDEFNTISKKEKIKMNLLSLIERICYNTNKEVY